VGWECRIKDDGAGEEWNMYGKQKCIQGWWENLKEEDTLEDLSIDGSMILKQSSGALCNKGNKSSDSIQGNRTAQWS
jgi:hypothetical protein